MSTTMLRALSLQEPGLNLRPDLVEPAQRITGLSSFICNHTRPDAYFACGAVAHYMTPDKMTLMAFGAVVRIAHYLVSTQHLTLIITPPRDPSKGLLLGYCDASHGTVEEGGSRAGYVVMSAGGGAIAWKGLTIRSGDDSPAATELRTATMCYKCILGLRMLLSDMQCGLAQAFPTPIYTDSLAVEQGTTCEKVNKASRWLATRYAMIRWGISNLSIILLGISTWDNPSDILTKCVAKDLFERHRAVLLGLQPPPPGAEGGKRAA